MKQFRSKLLSTKFFPTLLVARKLHNTLSQGNKGLVLNMRGHMHFMISSLGKESDNVFPIFTHGHHI
jgi:hypothetical protein